MKKELSIVLALILAIGLMACGGSTAALTSGNDTPAASDVSTEETKEEPEEEMQEEEAPEEEMPEEEAPEEEMPEIPVTKGEATVNVGDFTVTVPEGWLGAGDFDVDEKGNYYIESYYYYVVKGGESAEDLFVKPTVSIYYCSDQSAQELYDLNLFPEDENTDLDVTVGGKKCPAFHSKMDLSEDVEGLYMEKESVFIPLSDSSCFRVSMNTYSSDSTDTGDAGVNVEDKDVVAIMESLKVN